MFQFIIIGLILIYCWPVVLTLAVLAGTAIAAFYTFMAGLMIAALPVFVVIFIIILVYFMFFKKG